MSTAQALPAQQPRPRAGPPLEPRRLIFVAGIVGRTWLWFVGGCLLVTLVPILSAGAPSWCRAARWSRASTSATSSSPHPTTRPSDLARPRRGLHRPGPAARAQDPPRHRPSTPTARMTTRATPTPPPTPTPVSIADVRGLARLLVVVRRAAATSGCPDAVSGCCLLLFLARLVAAAVVGRPATRTEEDLDLDDGDGRRRRRPPIRRRTRVQPRRRRREPARSGVCGPRERPPAAGGLRSALAPACAGSSALVRRCPRLRARAARPPAPLRRDHEEHRRILGRRQLELHHDRHGHVAVAVLEARRDDRHDRGRHVGQRPHRHLQPQRGRLVHRGRRGALTTDTPNRAVTLNGPPRASTPRARPR